MNELVPEIPRRYGLDLNAHLNRCRIIKEEDGTDIPMVGQQEQHNLALWVGLGTGDSSVQSRDPRMT